MAKKSAKSKGYRKTVHKKPFLTKQETILLIVIVVALVAAVVLFNLFYDDGYLRASEVTSNDLVSFASRDITNRYVKLGEVHAPEGFSSNDAQSDVPLVTHSYQPNEAHDNIDTISISGNFNSAAQLSDNQANLYRLDDYVFSEVQTGTILGRDAYVYSVTYDYYSEDAPEADAAQEPVAAEEEAGEQPDDAGAATDASAASESGAETAEATEEEAEPESNVYAQSINCYIDLDDYSICIYINRSGDGASIYVPDGQLIDYVGQYASAITLAERGSR